MIRPLFILATLTAGEVRRHPDGLWTEIDLG